LTELLVSSVSTGGSGGEDRLTENVTLNFEEVHFTYWTQDDKGGKGTSSEYKYNIAENVKK
jgi:type VI secretion system secreted protein Hcp